MKKACGLLLMLLVLACTSACADEWLAAPGKLSLTQAVALAQPGDVIRLSPGIYAVPEEVYPVVIDKAVTLAAEEGAVLQSPLFTPLIRVEAPDVTIDGLTFQLLRWGVVAQADRLTLRNCSFVLADASQRVSSAGVWLAGAYDCVVSGCDFIGCSLCLAGPPLSARSSQMPVLTGLFEVGEDPRLFTSHTIEGNTVNGRPLYVFTNEKEVVAPADAGQVIAACCEGVTVDGLAVSDASMGIQIIHCSDVTVQNTLVERCGIFGVYLAYIDGGVLQNVTVKETNHGVDLRNVQSVLVTDFKAYDCEQGIFLTWAFDSVVDRCLVQRCGFGFFASVGKSNLLSRTQALENETGFYLQNESDTLIQHCEVTGSSVVGMRVLRSTGQILDNAIHDNWVGILASEADPLTIASNRFEHSASAHIYLTAVNGLKMMDNFFDASPEAEIETEGPVDQAVVYRNHFERERPLTGGLTIVRLPSE